MNFIELFAGIGGFRYGLEKAGESIQPSIKMGSLGQDRSSTNTNKFNGNGGRIYTNDNKYQCVYANEWDKYAADIYEKNFGERPDTRSITDVNVSDIPDHDLLVGGFPCQAFSIAGKRKGFDDTRGTLFFEIARILQAKRPRYLLLENVKGLLSHDGGRTFQIILQTLDELGYDLQWQVLNSKNFGVPQNRERVFIVGHLREQRRPEVFPIRENEPISGGQSEPGQGRTQTEVSATVRGGNMKADHTFIIAKDGKPKNKNYASTLSGGAHSGGNHSDMTMIHNVYGGFGETEFREFKDYSPTIRTPKGGGHLPMVKELQTIRRLTPVECERLQGFPDGWTTGVSDTQRYKCLGNAVTTNVITGIGERLIRNDRQNI